MKLMDRWLYGAVRLLLTTLGRLPKHMRDSSAVFLGRLTFKVALHYRKIVLQNLTRAFDRSQSSHWIETVARDFFINLWRSLFELGWSLTLPPSQYKKHFTVSGLDVYHKASARGKGVLVLGAHFGNWELISMIAHLADIPLRVVYRPLDAPFLDAFIKDTRKRYGIHPISNEKGAMRKIFRSLREGYPVGMLMDQGADWYDGVFVDFFNSGAFTNSGMALLALKTEAPVVPLFIIRESEGFHAVFGPELSLIKTGDRTKDIEANTQQYNNVIEAYARMYPDQWFWVHRRWKNLPFCPLPRTHSRISNRY